MVVTGATGFIGTAVVDRLRREEGARIVSVARTVESSADALRVALEDLDRVVWQRGGIERVDVLLHLGGFIPKSPDESAAIEPNFGSNLIGTRQLLESLPSVPAKIVFASSIDVYAPNDGTITEDSRVGPASLYGACKLFLEKLVRVYASANGCDATVLRVGHVYGPGEDAFRKIVPNVIRKMLKGEAPGLKGDGSVLRDYLFVSDAAEAFVRAAELPDDGGGPINAVTGSSVSLSALVVMLAEICAYPGEIAFGNESVRAPSYEFDNARFRSTLGDFPLTPLRRGLSMEVEYFRRRCDV